MTTADLLPAVAVVIPTLGTRPTLRACLESVIDQDYAGPIELWIVVDGNPAPPWFDELQAALPPLRSMQVLANERARGAAGARNTALERCTTPLIAFLDDDDRWHPGKITVQQRVMAESAVDLCATGIEMETSHGPRRRTMPAERRLRHADLLVQRHQEVHQSTLVVTRELLGLVGPYDERFPRGYAEDYDWLLRATVHTDVAIVPDVLASIEWTSASYFANNWAAMAGGLELLVQKHPMLHASRAGRAYHLSRTALAQLGLGETRAARRSARAALRADPRNLRAWLVLVCSINRRLLPLAYEAVRRRGRGL